MVKRIEQVLRALDRFQQRHGVLGFPVGLVKKYGDDQAGKHAALLAYYGFLSLFPLLLVFVTLLGYALANNEELQQQLIDTVIAHFPGFGPQLQGSITTIQGSGIGLVVGILGTLWGGLGITQSAQDAMNAVWNVPRKDRQFLAAAGPQPRLPAASGRRAVRGDRAGPGGHLGAWRARPAPIGWLAAAQPAAAGRPVPSADRNTAAVAAAAARRGGRLERAAGARGLHRQPTSWSGPTWSTGRSPS
jgi:Virulence factor BrkB